MVKRIACLLLLIPLPARAQGFERETAAVLNQLSLKRYSVAVEADESVATVVVEEVFFNPGKGIREADFLFPLPGSAAASGLELKMGGRYYGGNLLPRSRADEIYREITRRSRDPALLDCVGKSLFRCRVFPIPARGDASVRFAYRQPLAPDGAMRKLIVPLDAARFNRAPADRFALDVELRTKGALQAVFCPTHDVQVERLSAHRARVSLHARRAVLAGDLVLHYAVDDAPMGAVVASYREGNRPGYFVLSLDAAFAKEKQKEAPRDVVVAVDTSNSAGRNAVDAAAAALAEALATLRPGKDRFALMAFSTEPRLVSGFRHPDGDLADEIRALFAREPAAGRTRLGAALRGAARQAGLGRPGTGIVLLTDGLDTGPGADPVEVARGIAAQGNRVGFCGVGSRLDTVRLDQLGDGGRGDSAYAARSRDLGRGVRHLLETTRAVPLTDVEIEVGGAMQVYPKRQRMLQPGDAIVVAGRYRAGGEVTVRISGKVGGEAVRRALRVRLAERGGEPAVARLWAARRVGHLLDEARTRGKPDLNREEILQLGRRYGIVTPHTSLLVLEEADRQRFLRGMERRSLLMNTEGLGVIRGRRTVTAEVHAEADVAERIRRLKRCESGAADPFGDLLGKNRGRMRRVGERTFYRGEDGTWVESSLIGRDTSGAKRVPFLSEAWQALAKPESGLAKVLALGRRVLFVAADGTRVQVVE